MNFENPCFVNMHCLLECPNFHCEEIGYELILCDNCYFNTGECKDCLLEKSKYCRRVDNHD